MGHIIKKDGTITRPVAFHPGEMLDEELKARELSQAKFAELIQVPRSVVNEIIKGKRSITADFAIRIEAAFGTPSYMWVGWQTEYDLQKAQHDAKNVDLYKAIRGMCAAMF